ncbi:ribbon-helix-helix domain-containing protein [Stenomitos frigidus]|uniref:CopG-like ribbon-helix-helix domain-containing protein n=1 Tax=Stenomitos frigidus ULC18 TaxID=2107698 RepID=A0A2T1EMF2_9CYAN|nr:ribbon-helix-helix protein, CopG family [Stenomitos frigidus]PSB33929.1 hypothetical protein C7B82_03440 [Stenomitos frigidus ULC18]
MEKVAKKVFASVSDQLAEKLNKRAEGEGRSLSNLIGYLLEREMDDWQPEQQKPSVTQQNK